MKLNGEWFLSTASPAAHSDALAIQWQAADVVASARLIKHQGGVVIDCELMNRGSSPVTFNGWRPLMIDGNGAGLRVSDEPWRASVLINGYQSWDYAGIHPLDEAVKEGDNRPAPLSWWTAAICDGSAMFVAQVLKASRFATAFRWHYDRDEHEADALPTEIERFVAEQHGSPLSQPEQRSGLPEELQLVVPPGTGLLSDPILVLYGEDGTATLRRALAAAGQASGARNFSTVPRGWCSWYHIGLAVTERDIERNAAFLATRLPEVAKTTTREYRPVVQLDDGWMPRWQRWGDWVANEFFKGGMKSLTTKIHRHRQEAGIWLAPFHVHAESELARAHPDWLLEAGDGTRLVDPRLSTPYHLLDATHPLAQRFLTDLFTRLRRDGFSYFKLDFLYGAAYEARRHDADVTGIQALRLGIKQIVDAINPPGKPDTSFILACGAPLMPVVGLVHGARTGGDVGAPTMADDKAGPPQLGFPLILSMARNQAARLFFDRALFSVDADVAMAAAPQLSADEARVMITMAALSGGVFMLSDDLETLPSDRLALLRNPNLLGLVGGAAAEPVHLFRAPEREAQDHWFAFPQELPPLWVRPEGEGAFVVAIYNWSDSERPYRLNFAEATGSGGTYTIHDLWSARRGGRSLGTKRDRARVMIPAHGVRLLKMSPAAAPARL